MMVNRCFMVREVLWAIIFCKSNSAYHPESIRHTSPHFFLNRLNTSWLRMNTYMAVPHSYGGFFPSSAE